MNGRLFVFQLVLLVCTLFLLQSELIAQSDYYSQYSFTKSDSLRGALNENRSCYDVLHYDLAVTVHPESQSITGVNTMRIKAIRDFSQIQVDLFANMELEKVMHGTINLSFVRDSNIVLIETGAIEQKEQLELKMHFSGSPAAAKNAPWDGGFVWRTDNNDNPWIGVACEGAGASLWWPNKDHLSDEPDSMNIALTVPKDLYGKANGKLVGIDRGDKMNTFHWSVSYSINNYNVSLNIGDYIHWQDHYISADGDSLALNYFVLRDQLETSKQHFEQVKPMLACFEEKLGKYPFWNDGYSLVETSYLGMEHQSNIAYGNQYTRGYLGGMIPRDMDWDYIIVHESGHEYFGNSISAGDHAEMWIHESFTTYLETVYVECVLGKAAGLRYINHFRNRNYIRNSQPIIGPMNVNWTEWNSSDHYFKGAWVLHTLRSSLANDEVWFNLLKSLYTTFQHKIVTSDELFNFISAHLEKDYSAFFTQYFRYETIPVLEYEVMEKKGKVRLRYNCDVQEFAMDIVLRLEGKEREHRFNVTTDWQTFSLKGIKKENLDIATDLFLVKTKSLNP